MLMCSDATIFCSCSIVGRLTIVMVSPRLAVVGADGVRAGAGGDAADIARDGSCGNVDDMRVGLVSCRAGARGAPLPAPGDCGASRPGGRPAALRFANARAPMPSISAKPPACTTCASISRSMRPRSTTTMRSATSSTRSRFCSTISSETFSRLRSAARISPISCTIDGWMPSDGSSSSSSHGAGISARPSARICCSPPDSAPPLRSSSGRSRGKRIDHPLDGGGLDVAGVGAPGQAQVLERGQARQDAAALRHVAEPEAAALVGLHASHVDAVHRDAAAGGRHQTDQCLQEGGLADAVVADDADRFALAQLEVDAVQHRHVAVAGAQARDVEHDVALGGGIVGGVARCRCAFDIGRIHFARLPM